MQKKVEEQVGGAGHGGKKRPSPCILLKTGNKHLDLNLQADPVIANFPSWSLSHSKREERERAVPSVLFLATKVTLEIQAKCKILPGRKHSTGRRQAAEPIPGSQSCCDVEDGEAR